MRQHQNTIVLSGNPVPLNDTHLFSAASMLMASMMLLTFSAISLALIVCCSNFVFTADCEIHSCEAITHELL